MNVELIDEEGTMIQGTFFQDIADKFYDLLKENSVFIMTGGLVKPASAKFATIKHEYCIVFDKFTEITEIDDDGSVASEKAKAGFNFTSIDKIAEMNPMESVDIIGVVYMVGPVGSVQLKSGEYKQRRNILICDESKLTICVCFWGEKASSHDFSGQPVVAVKNAKVSDFAQKSLNANEDSSVYFNCTFEKAKDTRKWFDSLTDKDDFHALSTGTGLENMMKEPPKDETLFRFVQPQKGESHVNITNKNNPEEYDGGYEGSSHRGIGNTVEHDVEMKDAGDDRDDTDTGAVDRSVSPNEIRKKLFEERRKNFARRWFTKYNYFQKMREQKEISKRGRASSGIGEERIMQMELAKSMATRARKRGRKPKQQESALGLPQEFKFSYSNSHKKRGRKPGKYGNITSGNKYEQMVGGSSIPGVETL